jgi:hypothetical protein
MALRSGRQVPSVYFGVPGKLINLPWPASGIDKTYERQTSDFLTGAGLHQVSSMATGTRAYTVNWDALHLDSFNKISQYRVGVNGAGPFTLIDPSSPNLLDANVSAPSSLLGTPVGSFVTGVSGATGGVLAHQANSTYVHRSQGWASLKWSWATTPATTPILNVRPPSRNWYAYPTVPTLSYAFSSWVTVDGVVETNATVALKIAWLDAAGATLSTSAGSATAITTWTKLSVIAAAPANAAYMNPYWELTGSTMVSGGALYIDEVQLEQDTAVNDWAVGTGIRPIEIVGLTEKVPFDARFRTDVALSLRELAP